MLYRYKALSRTGANLSGEMEAVDRATVLEDLHQLGHFPIEVTELNAAAAERRADSSFFSGLPSARQITLFTRELAMLLKAGSAARSGAGISRTGRRIQSRWRDWSPESATKSAAAKACTKL